MVVDVLDVVDWCQDGDEGRRGASDHRDARCADRRLHGQVFVGEGDNGLAGPAVVVLRHVVVRSAEPGSTAAAVGTSRSHHLTSVVFLLLTKTESADQEIDNTGTVSCGQCEVDHCPICQTTVPVLSIFRSSPQR